MRSSRREDESEATDLRHFRNTARLSPLSESLALLFCNGVDHCHEASTLFHWGWDDDLVTIVDSSLNEAIPKLNLAVRLQTPTHQDKERNLTEQH